MTENITHALAYAAQGLPVFPVWWMAGGVCACRGGGFCKPGVGKHAECTPEACKACHPGKHPITPRGLHDASTDTAQVRKWWELAPAANVGVAVPDGFVVVDVDPRHDGVATYDALDAERGFPRSRMATTGGGGAHIWYRLPTGWQMPSKLGPGIDLKQLGGYVLMPSSNHVSGGSYSWASAPDADIAPAPPWLVALGHERAERSNVIVDDDEDERAADDVVLDGIVAAVTPHVRHGRMHDLCKNLSGWLKQRGYGPADVRYVVERLPLKNHANGVEAARAAFTIERAFGWAELKGIVGEPAAAALDAVTPNPRRARELEAAGGFAEALAAGAVQYMLAPAPVTAPTVANDMQPPPLPPGAGLPPIVGDPRGSQFWIVRSSGDYFAPVAKSMLPARAKEAGFRGPIKPDGSEAKIKADDLAAAATIAEKVVRDFAASGIAWHGAERAIVQGYALPRIAPVYDPQVAAWLQLLTGGRCDYVAQWFAACAQPQILKLAACLVLIGDTGIGKTLIAIVASRMWGATSPVPLAHAIDRFNSTIQKCPIVLDDEAARMKQGDVATNDFREMLSARERTYEPKGVDKRELRGCQRFVITCNAFSDLKFSDVGSLAVVEALADRLLVVPCGPADAVRAALQPLRLPETDDVDLPRLDGHVAWLVANTSVTTTRFLASPGRNDMAARQAVLDGLVQHSPEVFDQVLQAVERGEHIAPVDPPAVFVHGGVLWVRGDRVSGRLDARDVYRALAPWQLEPHRDLVKVIGGVVRARGYDLGRLTREAVAPARHSPAEESAA